MIAKISSATSVGFEGRLIEVECDASNGLPSLVIVGLGNKAIDEAKERVRSAIKNAKLDFPKKRITVNLAPANLPKHGAHFDLPIAIALLVVSGQLSQTTVNGILFAGELALDGTLRPITGAITYAEVAKNAKLHTIIVPATNAPQATLINNIAVLPATTLSEIVAHLKNIQRITPQISTSTVTSNESDVQIADIKGQQQAKRALTIAAAGRHNILLNGPPGSGKTMLAKSLISILPPLDKSEIVEVTKMHSIAGENYETVITQRPFRAPHHTASHVALTGGGAVPRPGEISLAHFGVLFMDELPEYSRQTLEALRQPLEDKYVTIARVNSTLRYPADFMLVATQNPCPCGYATDTERECTCRPQQIEYYQKKLSGPLLDRIDMVIEVGRIEPASLLSIMPDPKETMESIRSDITKALKIQRKRFASDTKTNATMSSKEVTIIADITDAAKALMQKANNTLKLSARSYFKVLKVARTIADIDGSAAVEPQHIAEALQFRRRDNNV